MKKTVFLILLLLFFSLTALPAAAAEEPQDYLDELIEGLPPLAGEALPDDPSDAEALAQAVGLRHLVKVVTNAALGAVPALFSSLLSLFGMVLLFALLDRLREGAAGRAARAGDAALGIALVLTTHAHLEGVLDGTLSFLSDLATLAEVASPVMAGLYLAGGNAATATAAGGGMAGLLLLLDALTGRVLAPLLRIMLGFLLVSAIGEVRTEGIAASLRTVYVTVLLFFCALISASVALGGVLGGAGDSFSLRTLRFAVGQMIPIVGSTVSSSLGTVMASVALFRGTAGTLLCAAILLPLLPLVVELLLFRLFLSLLSGACGILGTATPARLLGGFRALLDLALASSVLAGLCFLFLAATLAKTAPALW